MIRSISSTLSLAATFIAISCIVVAAPAMAQRPVVHVMHMGTTTGAARSITWRGYVDHAATIFFRGDNSTIDDVEGSPVVNFSAHFASPLPERRAVRVRLADVRGRGTVRVVQQPSMANNFTAGVRIQDPQPGRGMYRFHLTW